MGRDKIVPTVLASNDHSVSIDMEELYQPLITSDTRIKSVTFIEISFCLPYYNGCDVESVQRWIKPLAKKISPMAIPRHAGHLNR